ncbi:hypothetical protein J4E91_009297 [Alternaria rosae]|nr:hypothetical protein J4E91_009297 [Alternaria rosae]
MTESHLKLLLGFSDESLSDEELDSLLQEGLMFSTTPRKILEKLGVGMLDCLRDEQSAKSELIQDTEGPRQPKQLPFAGATLISNPASQTVQSTRKATGKADSFGHRVHRTFAPIPTNGRVVRLSGEGDIEAVHW